MSKAKELLKLLESEFSDKLSLVFDELIQKYNLKPINLDTNAIEVFAGQKDDAEILVEWFGREDSSWISVKVAFGEVRHTPSGSRTPYGEFGMVEASSQFGRGVGGQSIPGYEIEGLKWRIGGVAPKGRTSVIPDQYIQVDDIIAYLLNLEDKVAKGSTHPKDLTSGLWDKAEQGW